MDKKNNIVILHGWQSNLNNWKLFKKLLEKKFNVFLPKLPGFAERKLNKAWGLKDYRKWLANYLKNKKIKNVILVGHSFGGRLAIDFSSYYKVKKIVLIASAGIKPRLSLKIITGLLLAKSGRFIL